MAIVPESECNTPTLIVPWAAAIVENTAPAIASEAVIDIFLFINSPLSCEFGRLQLELQSESRNLEISVLDGCNSCFRRTS